jgi:phosphopantothenoylcysteine synthetase/decarboxylase
MTSYGSPDGNVLYLIVCAAQAATQTNERAKTEMANGSDVCVIATPEASTWFDTAEVEAATGHEVRSTFRRHDEPRFAPLGSRVVVAPATFNTINKAALGLADNLAVGLICEAIGANVSVRLEVHVSHAFANHPAMEHNVAVLARAGAELVWIRPEDPPNLEGVSQSQPR